MKLRQRILEAICKEIIVSDDNRVTAVYSNKAAEAVEAIVEDECIKFAEWSTQYYDEDLLPNQWINFSLEGGNAIISTAELFALFKQQSEPKTI